MNRTERRRLGKRLPPPSRLAERVAARAAAIPCSWAHLPEEGPCSGPIQPIYPGIFLCTAHADALAEAEAL